MDEVDDPTCIISLLEEFRGSAQNYYRSSMLPLNALDKNTPTSTAAKSRRSKFSDFGSTNADVPDKRAKIETSQDAANEGNKIKLLNRPIVGYSISDCL